MVQLPRTVRDGITTGHGDSRLIFDTTMELSLRSRSRGPGFSVSVVRMARASRCLARPAEDGPGPAVPGPPWHDVPLPLRRHEGVRAAHRGGVLGAYAAVVTRRHRPSGAVRPRRRQGTWQGCCDLVWSRAKGGRDRP